MKKKPLLILSSRLTHTSPVSLFAIGCLQPCYPLALGSAETWAKCNGISFSGCCTKAAALYGDSCSSSDGTSNPCHNSGCRISALSFQLSWQIWQPYLLFHLFRMPSHAYQEANGEAKKQRPILISVSISRTWFPTLPFCFALAQLSAQTAFCRGAGRAARWKWQGFFNLFF